MLEGGHLFSGDGPRCAANGVDFFSGFVGHHAVVGVAALVAEEGGAVLCRAPAGAESVVAVWGGGAVDGGDAGRSFSGRRVIDVHIDGLVFGVDGGLHGLGHVGAFGEEELEDLAVLAKPLVRLEERNVFFAGQSGSHALNVDLSLLFDAHIGEVLARVDFLVLLFSVSLLLCIL